MLIERARRRLLPKESASSIEQDLPAAPLDRCDDFDIERDRLAWLDDCLAELTTEVEVFTPSRWAEEKRYLPSSVTSMPGYYRFDVAPYLREIVDCLSVDSPVREVAVQKGVQLGLTVGVLENAIGYYIEHVKTAPMMLVTADDELAQLRLDSYVVPMLQHSGLTSLIKSTDEMSKRKSGKTSRKIEWVGGGFLVPFGAQNANKLRSISIRVMLRDEIDGWPLVVGKDGDPITLSGDRTAGYEESRKILDLSTPLVEGTSKIAQRFALGDQRYYYVCCVQCGYSQTLRWQRRDPKTGQPSGIIWEMDGGRLAPGSVRYLCERCGHPHSNDDKTRLLSPDHGAEWRPTATAASPEFRSYHISALYSPVGMQSWESCVRKWLEAWDPEHNRARDVGKLQVFYNNVLGEPFTVLGESIRFSLVSSHRRPYLRGHIPNQFAADYCGSPALLLTCAVDVHQDELAVAVIGWSRGGRALLIDYDRFEGHTERLDDAGTWGRLRTLIEDTEYVADDGKRYRIQLTLLDSGYRADVVYRFASEYLAGVFPVKGRSAPVKGALAKEFSPFITPKGTTGYNITVDFYKDRWSPALRRSWDGLSLQPEGHFNAPMDTSDRALKELTVEVRREVKDGRSGQTVGFEWHRPSGAANELWDLLVYNTAALELIAWDLYRNQLEQESVDWEAFYDLCLQQQLYFSE